MENNHPIPQDVTGFQFKLIGEMTVKQFAYLAAGVILAWFTFASPLIWIIKYPFVLLFAGLGVALAFVPIEGRPFDVMLINFLKAFIAPNQFIYQKTGYPVLPHVIATAPLKKTVKQEVKEQEEKVKISEAKLQKYLNSLPKTPRNSLDEKEMRFLGSLPLQQTMQQSTNNPYIISGNLTPVAPMAAPQTQRSETIVVAPQPVVAQTPHIITESAPQTPQIAPEKSEEMSKTLEKEAQVIEQELQQAKQEEIKQQNLSQKGVAHEKVIELERELADILSQKEKLQNQLITLKRELELQKQRVFSPSVATAPVAEQTKNVRIVPQGLGKSVGLPIAPDVANLLTGIVKDPRGNTLPNILVEVKDKDGNPVRAFKTNGLGQFAAATPLANGVYLITFEDPQGKQKFDTIELPINGMIIQPLEVFSIDEREELRKELFKS